MSRDISAANLAEINASHLHEVILVKLEFDTPVYVHSGIGTIVYDSNSYLGVGAFGSVTNTSETEVLRPTSLTLTLSGVDSNMVAEALDAGNYGDVVTIYEGYRQDDGTLVADPWIVWRGKYEYASIGSGVESVVSLTLQNDLAVLGEIDGSRYTDEEQQAKFTGDTGFKFVSAMASVELLWGGGRVGGGGRLRTRREKR